MKKVLVKFFYILYNDLRGDIMINLIPILSNIEEYIEINEEYVIDSLKLKESDIIELSKVKVNGTIKKKNDDEIYLDINVSGKMKINDSITLDEVWYPFSFEIDENLDEFVQKDENSLDIMEVLWQNIVLEVPLRYTTTEDYSCYQGDGWKLVSEEELVKNNPFSALLNEKDRSD